MVPADFAYLALWIFIFLYSVILHEISHGWMALSFGDSTAKQAGRLTLNPFKHLDWQGTVLFPILIGVLSQGRFIFGMAKPVPVRFDCLKPVRLGMVVVAASGPLLNLALGFIFARCYLISGKELFMDVAYLNLALCGFNLIPLPPLDGSKIVAGFLPNAWIPAYFRFEMLGFALLFLLYFAGVIPSVLRSFLLIGSSLLGLPPFRSE